MPFYKHTNLFPNKEFNDNPVKLILDTFKLSGIGMDIKMLPASNGDRKQGASTNNFRQRTYNRDASRQQSLPSPHVNSILKFVKKKKLYMQF